MSDPTDSIRERWLVVVRSQERMLSPQNPLLSSESETDRVSIVLNSTLLVLEDLVGEIEAYRADQASEWGRKKAKLAAEAMIKAKRNKMQ